MTSEEMFFSYRMLNPDVSDYSQCLFPHSIVEGMLDEGAGRVAVCQEVFERMGENTPVPGEIQALEDGEGRCLCLVRVEHIAIVPGRNVDTDIVCVPGRADDRLFCIIDFEVVFR